MSCLFDNRVSVDFGVGQYCSNVVPVFLASLSWSGRLDHSELGKDQGLRRLEVGSDPLDRSLFLFGSFLAEDQVGCMGRKPVRYCYDVVSRLQLEVLISQRGI